MPSNRRTSDDRAIQGFDRQIQAPLVTRDPKGFRQAFPGLTIVSPDKN
jgi:hypothetical protein